MADLDLYTLLTDPDAVDAEAKARAMTAALRRQQAVGMLGQLTGDKVLGQFGQNMVANSQHQQDQVGEAPRLRQLIDMQRSQQEKIDAENAAATNRRAALANGGTLQSTIRGTLGRQLGMEIPEGTPGEAIDDKELELAERIMAAKERAAAMRAVGAGGAGGGMTLTPEALDQAARMYSLTAQMPQLGMGKAAGALRAKIANRAAELEPGADLAGNKAGFHANQGSLAAMQKQFDAVNAFEETATKNLDTALSKAKGVIDTGSPLFNAPARKFAEMVMGDPRATEFNVARQVAIQEVSKVLSGAMGNGAVSDGARHEVEGLIGKDASLAQIEKAAAILKQDMANRKVAYTREMANIRARTGGKKESPAETTDAPALPPVPDGKMRIRNLTTGKTAVGPKGAVPDGWEMVP